MTLKTKRVLTEILKYKVYKLHETYLKEEFPCIYRKFLLRQVRQNTFSHSVENVKSKGGGGGGGEGLCRTYSIAFLVSGCREPIGNHFCQSPPCFWLQRSRRALPPDIVKLSGCVPHCSLIWYFGLLFKIDRLPTEGRREYVHCTRKIA